MTMRYRYLRNRHFARLRHSRKNLAALAAQGVRLTSSQSTTSITAAHIAAAAAVGTLTFGANAGNGKIVTIGDRVYTFKTALTEGIASGDLVTDNTNAADGSTVVIGSKTYTFEATLTNVDGHIFIGADADTTLLNLARAINASGGTPGTDYATANTIHPTVSASASVTAHTITLTAKAPGVAGNIATTASTSPDSHIDPEGALLTGGVDPVEDEVFIGAAATDSLDNLIAAIGAGSGEGTKYATGTSSHADVTAAAGTGDTMDVTAVAEDASGNAIATSTDVASASWGAITLVDGVTESFGPTFTAAAHGISHGEGPYVTANAQDTGLSTTELYWVARIDANTLALALSEVDALAGDYVAIAGNTAITIKKAVTAEGMFEVLRDNKPEALIAATDIDTLD